MALNFALQELKIYYNNIYELRVEEGKGKKGTPIKAHFIFIVTTLKHFLIVVARQAIKPQPLVGLFSFILPLKTRHMPIFSPEFVVFTVPFLSVSGMLCLQ